MTQVHAGAEPPIRDCSTAQTAFTGSKKCHPFNAITAAVTFHYDIMVRGSLYKCAFQTRLKCVIASFFTSTFTLLETKRLSGGKEGPGFSSALPGAWPSPSDLPHRSAQVGEQPIKLCGERKVGGRGGATYCGMRLLLDNSYALTTYLKLRVALCSRLSLLIHT